MATNVRDNPSGTEKDDDKKPGLPSVANLPASHHKLGEKGNTETTNVKDHPRGTANVGDTIPESNYVARATAVGPAGDDDADPQSSQLVGSRVKSLLKKARALWHRKKEGHGFWAIFVYSTILLVIVLAIIIALVVGPEELKSYTLAKEFNFKENMFNNSLKEMKMQFPNQTLRFWTILEKRVLAHLKNKQPTQPLVILMGAPPSAHSVIDCMAEKLVQTLDPVNDNSGYIDCTRLARNNSDEAKEIMDEKLERLFRKGDRTALILHLELLPPPSPFLFYSYCDTENAPFKKAGIIFTVHLPEEPDLSLLPVDRDGMIERYLAEAVWSKFDDQDGVSALLSRIADTVALVSGETEQVVKLNCPTHLS